MHRIGEKYDLKLILLFGSQVTGRVHEMSDIDIAVRTRSGKGVKFADLLDLTADLTGLFEKDVDLSVLDHADPLFLYNVVEGARLLCGEEKDFDALRLKAFKKYQDFRPILELERQFLLKEYNAGVMP
ncbi:MAG: nucleotidyltransferase domain-containing protein [Deltaproteobacteria bacterium]|nr:nucleotidyltransferase domain-containing protein [Deltaproteobacteria bacterium]